MSSIMEWLPPFHFLDCLTWASYQCFILFNVILFKYDIFIRKNQHIKMILRFSFFSSSLRLSNVIHVFDADFILIIQVCPRLMLLLLNCLLLIGIPLILH